METSTRLRSRTDGRPVDEQAGGVLVFDGADRPASVDAALVSIGDGCVGSRAVSECSGDHSSTATAVAGVYGPEPDARLVWAPPWTPVDWQAESQGWELDLGAGEVRHRLVVEGGADVATTRAALAGHRGVQFWSGPGAIAGEGSDAQHPTPVRLAGDARTGVLVFREQGEGDRRYVVMAAGVGPDGARAERQASARLAGVPAHGLDRHQRERWAERWRRRPVEISGDPDTEQRVRHALFRLLCLLDHDDEMALGARGLTGPGYLGHVFWDTDVFVLPAIASVAPTAARAMVEYRLRRLDGARRHARATGFAGARFPWESAASGLDVTPRRARRPDGDVVPIRTGELEVHISADVCWAIDCYRRWSASDEVLAAGGAELTAEVARFWASRVTEDFGPSAHLRHVIGPDEYHEDVDDNAFTNQMGAWTLRRAADLVDGGWPVGTSSEASSWRALARRLPTGFDPTTGLHLQFDGYRRLQPVLAQSIAVPPFPADLLLGRAQVAASQLIKQADVLMLHTMIPGDLPPGSLATDLDYYLPRTTHGSSLSPATHAELLARLGRPDEATRWFDLALGVDLDDLTGTGAGGLHYATLGGAWQAFLHGFLGVRLDPEGLALCPSIPTGWGRVAGGFTYAGAEVQVVVENDTAVLTSSEPITVVGGSRSPAMTATARFVREGRDWRRT